MGILHYMSCKQNEVKKKKKLILVVLQDTKGKVACLKERRCQFRNLGPVFLSLFLEWVFSV